VVNIFIDVLETIVAHASEEEPRTDVFVLLFSDGLLALGTAVHKDCREVAGELALVLSNQTPL
jgi:hypothetical protein